MAEEFETERARREILSCENIETLKDISLLLLKTSLSQKQMIGKLMFDQLPGNLKKD